MYRVKLTYPQINQKILWWGTDWGTDLRVKLA